MIRTVKRIEKTLAVGRRDELETTYEIQEETNHGSTEANDPHSSEGL